MRRSRSLRKHFLLKINKSIMPSIFLLFHIIQSLFNFHSHGCWSSMFDSWLIFLRRIDIQCKTTLNKKYCLLCEGWTCWRFDYLTAEMGAVVLVFISSLLFLKFSISSLTLFVVLDLYVSLIDSISSFYFLLIYSSSFAFFYARLISFSCFLISTSNIACLSFPFLMSVIYSFTCLFNTLSRLSYWT